MDLINQGAAAINNGFAYLRNNAWPIAFMLCLWFYLKPKVVAAMEDIKIRRSPQQVQDYDRDLRRVRQLQQIQAEQDAKIKAQQLKEKKRAEILAQDVNAKKKTTTTTTTKPKTASTKKTDLSMDHFSTPSYRPQRRTVRKG